jgi:hypothetical protein
MAAARVQKQENRICSLNLARVMEHISGCVAHFVGILHTPQNRVDFTPPLNTDTVSRIIQTDNARKFSKMRRSPGNQRVVSVEEHDELVSMVQNLQIQLRALSAQVLSITEITIQHRGEQQRNKDECEALRQQIEALQFVVGPVSPSASPTTAISDEASSPGPRPRLDLNLRPSTEEDSPAPDQNKL